MTREELRKKLKEEQENDPIIKKIKCFNYALMTGGGIVLVIIDNPLWINVFGFGMALLGVFKFAKMLDRERGRQ